MVENTENTENTENVENTVKRKIRRKKSEINAEKQEVANTLPKKRGRKPKGGKIINKAEVDKNDSLSVTNIILHLKCSLQDLDKTTNNIISDPSEYIPQPPPNIMAYEPNENEYYSAFNQTKEQQSAYVENKINIPTENIDTICSLCKLKDQDVTNNNEDDDIDIKDVNTKLKQIKLQLYKNSNPDKKSACFWCTYDYDTPPCYVPKYELDGELCGYGSFCRPECAVAYLLKENIDDSIKFERYHLLNKVYGKVYDFKRNIKPAPDPHYILDKFYGNLSIQEYRKLLKTEHMLLVIEKPMTRILPELHENTDDMDNIGVHGARGNSTSRTGVYKVKRQSEKPAGPNKNDIMKETFGF